MSTVLFLFVTISCTLGIFSSSILIHYFRIGRAECDVISSTQPVTPGESNILHVALLACAFFHFCRVGGVCVGRANGPAAGRHEAQEEVPS